MSAHAAFAGPSPDVSPAAPPPPPAEALGRVHLVGIGGAGMSGIARVLLARGIPVSGSDAQGSAALDELAALGATVHVGHAAGHLADADTVVVSSAIAPDNPELVEARRRRLRVLRRAEALASVMAGHRAVAVAGTHGKTTTTAMLVVALQRCGADPSYAIGGTLTAAGTNAGVGSGDLFVAEADESDGSFLAYRPQVAVVTNIEPDHLDHFGTPQAVEDAFLAFTHRLPPGGVLVACADDPGSHRLAERVRRDGGRVVTYGEHETADLRLDDLRLQAAGSRFAVVHDGEPLGVVEVPVPGRHNALNAAAALAAGLAVGCDADRLRAGLGAFAGTRRRFELKGSAGGVRVFDDYAHHPTEIEATLRAARDVAGDGRVVALFQPHRYTRTAAFAPAMGVALGSADAVVVMDVYPAGEKPIPGVSGASVAAAVPLPSERAVFEPVRDRVPAALADRARPGDIVLTMGAGDVTWIGPELLALLSERSGG